MPKILARATSLLALLATAVAFGPPAAAQGAEPMYNITRWGDHTAMTVAIDAADYSVWPNEFYHQFDCGLAGGYVGVSVMLDDPMTGDLSYMTDTSTNTVRWVGYNTATGPSGGVYMVLTAVADTTDCNWPAQGTVLTQWYQGENFDRQPDITNRAIDPTWFLDAGTAPPVDPTEFWGKNLNNTGWGLTVDTPPVIVEGGSDSGFGSIDLHVVVEPTPPPTEPPSSSSSSTSTKQPAPTTPSTPASSTAAGGAGSGSGAAGGGAGGGGGGGTSIIALIILILAAFLIAGGSLAWMRKKRVGLWSMTREMGKLVTQLPPDQKQELVQGFRDTHNKTDYIEYLKGLRDYNLGFTDQPPTPPEAPVKDS